MKVAALLFTLLVCLAACKTAEVEEGYAAAAGHVSLKARAEIDIGVLKEAVGLFRMSEKRLPRDSEWPDFLVNGSQHHKEPYIDEERIQYKFGEVLDPWGNPYVYRRLSARGFEIISYGADGVPGGEGDDADIRLRKEGK